MSGLNLIHVSKKQKQSWLCGVPHNLNCEQNHYGDVIMGAKASQITSLTIVYSTVYSDADQGKHQSSASLAFVRGIHRGPVNSPHKWPVTRKMFPFDDVIMINTIVGPIMKWVLGQLICWDPDKMAAILQTTFQMHSLEIVIFWLTFRRLLLAMVKLTMRQHQFR